MAELPNPANDDLSRGYTVSQVADKYGWTEPMVWSMHLLNSKEKSDLIIFDPPCFDKKADDYAKKSISMLPRKEYLKFFEDFFTLMKQHTKNSTKLAFINADWRDFQNKPANDETLKTLY